MVPGWCSTPAECRRWVTGNDLDYLLGTLERLRDNTAVIPRDHEDAQAYLRAIVDHAERREREAQAEAE